MHVTLLANIEYKVQVVYTLFSGIIPTNSMTGNPNRIYLRRERCHHTYEQ